jgi:hypothetical protein
MSCKFRVAVGDTYLCKVTQSQCLILKDTEIFNQDNCEIHVAFKDLKI